MLQAKVEHTHSDYGSSLRSCVARVLCARLGGFGRRQLSALLLLTIFFLLVNGRFSFIVLLCDGWSLLSTTASACYNSCCCLLVPCRALARVLLCRLAVDRWLTPKDNPGHAHAALRGLGRQNLHGLSSLAAAGCLLLLSACCCCLLAAAACCCCLLAAAVCLLLLSAATARGLLAGGGQQVSRGENSLRLYTKSRIQAGGYPAGPINNAW